MSEALEAQQAEVEAEGRQYVQVELDGTTYRVVPQREWRLSCLRALNEGDFEAWAEAVMHPDDHERFLDADPTLGEFQEFARQCARASGDGLGKSTGRRR